MAEQARGQEIERALPPDATVARGVPRGSPPAALPRTARARLRDGGIVIIATLFTVMTIGVAMLITRGQRVGIVGGLPGPTPAAVPSATARLLPPAPPVPARNATGSLVDNVPAGFQGTWSGTLANADGSRSWEDSVTVRPGPLGDEYTTAVVLDTAATGGHERCPTAWTLLTAGSHQLTFRSRPLPGSPAGCPTATAEQTLARNTDGTVTHSWVDTSAGTLTGVLDQGP